jgi:hypothetical protein
LPEGIHLLGQAGSGISYAIIQICKDKEEIIYVSKTQPYCYLKFLHDGNDLILSETNYSPSKFYKYEKEYFINNLKYANITDEFYKHIKSGDTISKQNIETWSNIKVLRTSIVGKSYFNNYAFKKSL